MKRLGFIQRGRSMEKTKTNKNQATQRRHANLPARFAFRQQKKQQPKNPQDCLRHDRGKPNVSPKYAPNELASLQPEKEVKSCASEQKPTLQSSGVLRLSSNRLVSFESSKRVRRNLMIPTPERAMKADFAACGRPRQQSRWHGAAFLIREQITWQVSATRIVRLLVTPWNALRMLERPLSHARTNGQPRRDDLPISEFATASSSSGGSRTRRSLYSSQMTMMLGKERLSGI